MAQSAMQESLNAEVRKAAYTIALAKHKKDPDIKSVMNRIEGLQKSVREQQDILQKLQREQQEEGKALNKLLEPFVELELDAVEKAV